MLVGSEPSGVADSSCFSFIILRYMRMSNRITPIRPLSNLQLVSFFKRPQSSAWSSDGGRGGTVALMVGSVLLLFWAAVFVFVCVFCSSLPCACARCRHCSLHHQTEWHAVHDSSKRPDGLYARQTSHTRLRNESCTP